MIKLLKPAVSLIFSDQAVPYDDAEVGAAVAVQSFGDFQNFHPHLHVLATDGCFYNDGAFMIRPPPKTAELEELFRHEVFKMLKVEGKINDTVIENMLNRYCGFYSNKSRGLRKKAADDEVPALIESEASPKEFRKNWARLI